MKCREHWRYTLEDAQKAAEKRGGKCLATSYVDCKTHLLWKCENGHEWLARFDNVVSGKWCPKCAHQKVSDKRRIWDLAKAQEAASANGGQCLSKRCSGITDKLSWSCSNGHEWQASFSSIINSHTWCPYCSKYKTEGRCRFIIEQITGLKFPKNREALDNLYELDGYNKDTQYAFEYQGAQHYHRVKRFHKKENDFPHQQERDIKKLELCNRKNIRVLIIPYWEAETDESLIDYILENLFQELVKNRLVNLSEFYKNHPTLNQLREFAATKGGEILSNVYINSDTKIECKCKKGHIWKTRASNLKRGHWCTQCTHIVPHTIEEMKSLAESRNGFCLSSEYKGAHFKLTWQCIKGHVWDAEPAAVLCLKTWCPHCWKEKLKSKEHAEEVSKWIRKSNLEKQKCVS